MKHRYCANQIQDIDTFNRAITSMGGVIIYRSLFVDGFYQCWFDVEGELNLDEAITFTMLYSGVQSLTEIKVEIY